jgi:Na+-translocating ferredoxin:NAD+ oxidoreductase RnfE subunit
MSALCALMFVDIPVITKMAGLCPLLFCCGCFLILVVLVLSNVEVLVLSNVEVKFPIGIYHYK